MSKKIIRVVLTGGPAAGKTTFVERIKTELGGMAGWRLITIPETATELMSGFGFGPFPGCMSMEQFQYFVIPDQLHKEQIALDAAQIVPEENVLIVYDRGVFDDKAYISDEQFAKTLADLDHTEEEILGHYDAVIHLVTCAKGSTASEYNYNNSIRYETQEGAVIADDRTLRAWSAHPNRRIIENVPSFDEKMQNAVDALREIIAGL